MKEEKSKEVSVKAAITDSSLSVSTRSRAIAALDHLLGGFFGIPAAWLERIEERIRNQTRSESIIQNAAAKRMKTAIANEEEVSGVVAEMALCSRLVPIANKLRVTELAVDALLTHRTSNESQDRQEGEGNVDQDWLNHFATYAERASSEGVRQLWARVLAGEIRRTGSFSLSSLRLLSELDQRMATTFQNEVKYRVRNDYILKPKIEEMKGARLESLSFMEEVGLLQSIDAIGGVARKISPGSDGKGTLRENNLLLLMEMRRPVELSIIPLTRIGREIATILPPADPLMVLERVGEAIRDKVTSMEIRRIVQATNGRYVTAPLKTLKAAQG